MKIFVTLLGPIKNPYAENEHQFILEKEISLGDFLASHYEITHTQAGNLVLLSNNQTVMPAYLLQNNDYITVFLAAGGG